MNCGDKCPIFDYRTVSDKRTQAYYCPVANGKPYGPNFVGGAQWIDMPLKPVKENYNNKFYTLGGGYGNQAGPVPNCGPTFESYCGGCNSQRMAPPQDMSGVLKKRTQ